MKSLIKLTLIVSLFFGTLYAKNINECKTDIYFANGILTVEEDARSNAMDVLEPAIRKELYTSEIEMYKDIGKVDYAYNQTVGEKLDLWESTYQILDLQSFVDAGYADHNYNSDKTLKM